MKETTAPTLNKLLRDHPGMVIIDTRLASDFEKERIPGSVNNCVYEIEFDHRLEKMAPDQSKPVCVYGAARDSYESKMAAEKLVRAGYGHVLDLREGIEGWKQHGLTIEGSQENDTPVNVTLESDRSVDLDQSHIEWTGRNLANKHWGTLRLKSGKLHFKVNGLVGGTLVIDMHTIRDLNLENGKVRQILEDHLKSHDFFDVEKHPEATLTITKASPMEHTRGGAPNLQIAATLTMKGVTEEIEFHATSGCNAEGQWIAQANFDFDRTRWNVIYGSGKFFRNLGMHLVNDLITLQIKIVA